MEPLPWYEKSTCRGLIIQLGLSLLVFISAYIANTDGVELKDILRETMETIIILFIIVMIIVLAVSLYRWMKGQSARALL